MSELMQRRSDVQGQIDEAELRWMEANEALEAA